MAWIALYRNGERPTDASAHWVNLEVGELAGLGQSLPEGGAPVGLTAKDLGERRPDGAGQEWNPVTHIFDDKSDELPGRVREETLRARSNGDVAEIKASAQLLVDRGFAPEGQSVLEYVQDVDGR